MCQMVVITPLSLWREDKSEVVFLIFLCYFLARFKLYCYLCAQLN